METIKDSFVVLETNNVYAILVKLPFSVFTYMSIYYQNGNIGDFEVTYKIALN